MKRAAVQREMTPQERVAEMTGAQRDTAEQEIVADTERVRAAVRAWGDAPGLSDADRASVERLAASVDWRWTSVRPIKYTRQFFGKRG